MIASLSGTVLAARLDCLVLDVGGVGMLVHTTPATAAAARAGQHASLATTLVVREDSLTLYGFGSEDEKVIFETVQTVSGVGPRLALALLSVHPPERVRAALGSGDVAALTKVPGIGRKGAERLVLELRDKLGVVQAGGPGPSAAAPAVADPGREQVRDALVGLGWSVKQADDALDKVVPRAADGTGVSALLRAALQELGR